MGLWLPGHLHQCLTVSERSAVTKGLRVNDGLTVTKDLMVINSLMVTNLSQVWASKVS